MCDHQRLPWALVDELPPHLSLPSQLLLILCTQLTQHLLFGAFHTSLGNWMSLLVQWLQARVQILTLPSYELCGFVYVIYLFEVL